MAFTSFTVADAPYWIAYRKTAAFIVAIQFRNSSSLSLVRSLSAHTTLRLCGEEEQLALALLGAVSSGTCATAVAVRLSVSLAMISLMRSSCCITAQLRVDPA